MKAGAFFERGFVSHIRCTATKHVIPTLGAPEWGTVTEIDLGAFHGADGHVNVLRALPKLTDVRGLEGPELASFRKVPWSTLGFSAMSFEDVVAGVAELRDATAVRTLIVARRPDAMPPTKPEISEVLRAFPNLEEAQLDLETKPADVAKLPECKRLRRLTIVSVNRKPVTL